MARYHSKIITIFLIIIFISNVFFQYSGDNSIPGSEKTSPQSSAALACAMATTANHATSIWFNHQRGERDIEWLIYTAIDLTSGTYKTGAYVVQFKQINHIDNLIQVTDASAMSNTANNLFTFAENAVAVIAASGTETILPFTVHNRYTGYLYQTAGTSTYTHSVPAAAAGVCNVATMDDVVDYGIATTWESNIFAATLYWHLEPSFTIVSSYYNLDNIRLMAYNTISASWVDVDPRNPILSHPQYKLKIYDSSTNTLLFEDSSTQYFTYQRNITITANPLADIAIKVIDQNSVYCDFGDFRIDDGTTILSIPEFQALIGSSKTFNAKDYAGVTTYGSTTLNPVLEGLNNVIISVKRWKFTNNWEDPIYITTTSTAPILTDSMIMPYESKYIYCTDETGNYAIEDINNNALVASTVIPADEIITYNPLFWQFQNYWAEPIYITTTSTAPILTNYIILPYETTIVYCSDATGNYVIKDQFANTLVASTPIPATNIVIYIPDYYAEVNIQVVDQNLQRRDPLNEKMYETPYSYTAYFRYGVNPNYIYLYNSYCFYYPVGDTVTIGFYYGGLTASGSWVVNDGLNTIQFDVNVIDFCNNANFEIILSIASTAPTMATYVDPYDEIFIYGTDIVGTYAIYDADDVELLSSGSIPADGRLSYSPSGVSECIIRVQDQNSKYCELDDSFTIWVGATRTDTLYFYALIGASITITIIKPSTPISYEIGSTTFTVDYGVNYVSVSVKRLEIENDYEEPILLTTTGTEEILTDYQIMPYTTEYCYLWDITGNYIIEDIYGETIKTSTAIPANGRINYIPDYNLTSFIALFDQRSNYLDWEQFKLYKNGSILYENIFSAEIGSTWNISVYDRFDQYITSKSHTVSRDDNYIDIQLTIHSLKVFNQQEVFNFINITRNPITSEEWTEWLAPNEIIQFRLLAGNYNVEIESNENSSSLNYAYTLAGDDILLLTSQNTLSNAIMNIVNTNVTLGNQITAVNISITNTQTNISNQIVSVNIDLNNINSTLDAQLINIQANLLNLDSNITTMYAFINNSFITLNSTLGTQFLNMNTTLTNINNSISLLIADMETTVLLVNNSIYTAVVDLETQLLLINNTISGNLTLILQLNPELSAIYTNCLFSKNLTWSTNLTSMYEQFDYYAIKNHYRNESLELQLRYGNEIIVMGLEGQETINRAIKTSGTQFRVKSVRTGEYLENYSTWQSLPSDKKLNLGFYDEIIPATPEQVVLEHKDFIMIGVVVIIALAVFASAYIRMKSQLEEVPTQFRTKPKPKSSAFIGGKEDLTTYFDVGQQARTPRKKKRSWISMLGLPILILIFGIVIVIYIL